MKARRDVQFVLWTFAALVTAILLGCGASTTGSQANVPPGYEHIASIHKARCGRCHRRIEPGDRTRDQLEPALARHRNRVHLSEDEWNLMVDYLAADRPAPPPE